MIDFNRISNEITAHKQLNAKMRSFRSKDISEWPTVKEGPLVWILEHDFIPAHPSGKAYRKIFRELHT